ncbi:hypothetical protein CU097_013090 [Rhizopus azygosporus]|uniref:Uncharacterized protein n=1 Tax=Rhizopus azygosporus TaxID=86630 RepID=A0A367JXJ7_RHIAZ|nr:hypothetical protein CU097_013090 [Rhizopus azygosporus]
MSTISNFTLLEQTRDPEKTSYQELPLTPSSALSFLIVRDQKEECIINNDNKSSPIRSQYGAISLGSSSSTASTISPNDDNESLYLLWTHQLLKEKGYNPSSYNIDDDCNSIDSSITDVSIPQSKHWLYNCFPIC